MDPNSIKTMAASAGAGGDKVYVDDVFSTYVYSGNNTTGRDIVNGIDLAGEGGLVWIKKRDASENHVLINTERGADKFLMCDTNDDETTTGGPVTDFNSNGFEIDNNGYVNGNGADYVSWTFRKQKGFFDVVTWTGNNTAGREIAHNLGSVPGFIMVKNAGNFTDWKCYHRSIGENYAIELNETDEATTQSDIWNGTAPTSTHFTIGNSGGVNEGSRTFVAFLFAHDDQQFGDAGNESIIKCGTWTGDGAADGPTIDLGWEPQWLITKNSTYATYNENWAMMDTMRGWDLSNADGHYIWLAADSNTDEGSNAAYRINSQGFQVAGNGAGNINTQVYFYVAIRRPMKPPEAGTEVFATQDGRTATTDGSTDIYTSGFPVDLVMQHTKATDSTRTQLFDRVRGEYYLKTHNGGGETSGDWIQDDSMTGLRNTDGTTSNTGLFAHMFKRAPGFMDIVGYDGNSVTTGRNIEHNLGAVPELMIVKGRDFNNYWMVYHKDAGATKYYELNGTGGPYTMQSAWYDTTPTSTVFTVGGDNSVNYDTKKHIAYLFASLPGISKVGSYTGTGNEINVDCGFNPRFLMIKRSNGTGDWTVYDTTQGITAGNDPVIRLNTTDAQDSSMDNIDPLTDGFTVEDGIGSYWNASDGTYLFLAIA